MKKILTTLALFFIINNVSADDITFTVINTKSGGNTGSIDLTMSGVTAPYVYSWQGPSGFTSKTEDISSLVEGKYTVTVTDKYCGIAKLTIDVSVGSTGIEEVANQIAAIYPNPTTGQLTVTTNALLNKATIQVTNGLGETVVEKKQYSGNSLMLDISAIKPGVYFIQINNEGNISRKKILKN
ncbi:MAG: T9SS type A sorting domain-containing protein [Bacteroidia bacterium]